MRTHRKPWTTLFLLIFILLDRQQILDYNPTRMRAFGYLIDHGRLLASVAIRLYAISRLDFLIQNLILQTGGANPASLVMRVSRMLLVAKLVQRRPPPSSITTSINQVMIFSNESIPFVTSNYKVEFEHNAESSDWDNAKACKWRGVKKQ